MDIFFRQHTARANFQILGHFQSAHGDPRQLCHMISSRRKHPPHLVIFSLVQTDQRLTVCALHRGSLCRQTLCAIRQHHALCHLFRIAVLPGASQHDVIVFRHVTPCRNDLVRQLPVIGEQQHPGRVFVQPSHRSQVLPAQLRRHKFQNALLPRLIRSLSKGYRQRVGVAQALLGSPQLIILDEPTVGLDPAQVIELRRLIRELGRTHTVILSSHILSEVKAVCDKALILSQGHLAAVVDLTAEERDLEELFLELTAPEETSDKKED